MGMWDCSLIAVNKMKNITSAKMVDKVKNVVVNQCQQLVKMGHGGTLDETATGVLVIGTGHACKFLPHFLHGNKMYTVGACMGIETDTYNECGQIIDQKPYLHVDQKLLVEKLKVFQGKIYQVPPKYSALKMNGQRVADLTRSGIKVELNPRQVMCHSLNLVKFDPPFFELEVVCGGGFYIRSLVHDLGRALGTCSHVTTLHRNRHGFLGEADALPSKGWSYTDVVENACRIASKIEYQQMTRKMNMKFNRSKNQHDLWIDLS